MERIQAEGTAYTNLSSRKEHDILGTEERPVWPPYLARWVEDER